MVSLPPIEKYFLFTPFIERVSNLYSLMDKDYSEAAAYYGFSCAGCENNCCEERFYHYTIIEHLYILEGIKSLDGTKQKDVFERAEEVIQIYGLHDQKGIVRRVFCPLNFDGLCILYDHRPMICRLHGIPHEVKNPDYTTQRGPGCNKFKEDIATKKYPYHKFDRTSFYSKMAAIEIELRRSLQFNSRYKKTVAGMIIDISDNKALLNYISE
jgi:Fe-S-cluster containining protein